MELTFEINNKRLDSQFTQPKFNAKSQIVEIFSAITEGKDYSQYGKKVDTVVNHVKELANKAHAGDFTAKAELNSIVRYTIEPHLEKQIQLFSFMGRFRDIPYNEQPMVQTYKHESLNADFQASSGDVGFSTTSWEEYPINTKTISAGFAVDYREVASGNLDKIAEGKQQVQTVMMNKAMNYVVYQLYTGIKNATGIKYFSENAGITKSALDDALKKIRRFGRPSIAGDYSVVSQLSDFAGHQSTSPSITGLSEAVMEEIRLTGMLQTYNGSPVLELPNQYQTTQLNSAGDNFKTYLPEGLLFLIPQGNPVSPLQVFRRGGLTSMTGTSVETGTEVTRYDMEIGAEVVRGREYEIGLISDENFAAPSY
ncbi:hypothetical protein [Halalkalibacter oceani]|uniref:hypothetical protein n=1 Tax=Halalkalibacter oceani TaxID=1653776 RepID=UPI003397FCA3